MSNTITLSEFKEAKRAYIEAQEAMNYADKDFVETAVYQYKMAEARLNALIKRAKENAQGNVIQFPIQSIQEQMEEQCWQETVMERLGPPIGFLALGLGIVFIVAQLGMRIGW